MASNRHLGRILALQTLYEYDFRRDCGDEAVDIVDILQRNIERYAKTVDDKAFIGRLSEGVVANSDDLDAVLQPIAPEWPIAQIARMDKMVLRLSLYELLSEDDVPPKVVINEAVELSKAFGGENSSKFINGVLGTVLRKLDDASLELPASLQLKKHKPSPKETVPKENKNTTQKQKEEVTS